VIKKLMKILLLLIFAGLLLISCANDNGEHNGNGTMNGNDEEQIMQFVAAVLEVDENSILVEPAEGEEILRSGDRVSVSTGALDPQDIPEIAEGDTVRIFYSGGVMESYPLQLGEVRMIELVEE